MQKNKSAASEEREGHVHGPDCDHDHENGVPQVPHRRETPKLGRNDPCYCGSGRKYKKCHANAD